MRNIQAYKRSTPTYVYNVTGADAAGIDIDALAIGMVIKWETYTVYILPSLGTNSMFDIDESDTTVKTYESDTYCRHYAGTNSFIITLPLWRLPTAVTGEAIYQIFLFNKTPYSVGETDASGGINPAMIQAINIVIDNGGFELLDSYVPPIAGETEAGGIKPKRASASKPGVSVF